MGFRECTTQSRDVEILRLRGTDMCTVLVIMYGAVLSLDKAEGEATRPSTVSGDKQWCGYLWTLPTGRLGAARVSHIYMHTCTHTQIHMHQQRLDSG